MAKATSKAGRGKPVTKASTQRKRQTAPGPITLAEARTRIAAPKPAQRGAAAASPATELGQARRNAARGWSKQIEQRRREYRERMRVLEKQGALATTAAGFAPLRILAEGDSWFDYPPLARGGLIPRLAQRLGVPILNLATAGDEVRYMLGVQQRQRLAAELQRGKAAGRPWEVLLFSGGGNDAVDNPLVLWLHEFQKGVPARQLVQADRYKALLALVRAGYEDLIRLRDALSPGTWLLFHAYDFAIPDGRSVCAGRFGPWLQPAFRLRGFPLDPPTEAGAVVRVMLEDFARMLERVAKDSERVRVVPTQGVLSPETASWHNEMHPSDKGFEAMATVFETALRGLFPGRVA